MIVLTFAFRGKLLLLLQDGPASLFTATRFLLAFFQESRLSHFTLTYVLGCLPVPVQVHKYSVYLLIFMNESFDLFGKVHQLICAEVFL